MTGDAASAPRFVGLAQYFHELPLAALDLSAEALEQSDGRRVGGVRGAACARIPAGGRGSERVAQQEPAEAAALPFGTEPHPVDQEVPLVVLVESRKETDEFVLDIEDARRGLLPSGRCQKSREKLLALLG